MLSLIHLAIVFAAASLDSGDNIQIFNEVFDPRGFPFSDRPMEGMKKLFQVPGFQAEEWPHVLIWDLLVGRMIYLDGLARGIFTAHSVLLCNLIGPPGLLLHAATCLAVGKPLPTLSEVSEEDLTFDRRESGHAKEVNTGTKAIGGINAAELVKDVFSRSSYSPDRVADACASDVIWEDLSGFKPDLRGREAVLDALRSRPDNLAEVAPYVLDKVADGERSTGFTWHREAQGVNGWGLRGTTFVELNEKGEIAYVREIAEPLLKPGGSTEGLLKALAKPDAQWFEEKERRKAKFRPRKVHGASDMVQHLWLEMQGQDNEEILKLFSDDITYEDFNFPVPFRGKQEVAEFLTAFNIPGITFIPEKFSEGNQSACFTWFVEIAGVEGQKIRGISFYELDADGRVCYIRDIAEPAIKPPPLLAVASTMRPGIRRFAPAAPLTE